MVPKDACELRRAQWKVGLRAQLRACRAALPAHRMAFDALGLEHLPSAFGAAARRTHSLPCVRGARAYISDQVVHLRTLELRPASESLLHWIHHRLRVI